MNPSFVPKIRSIYISNYKSIEKIFLDLGDFNVLVGANGSGKSNFIDALSFINDCVSGSLEMAFRNRGGIGAVRRRSGGHPTHIGIRIIADVSENMAADYLFEISAKPGEAFSVSHERCIIDQIMGPRIEYEVKQGHFEKKIPGIDPVLKSDRLALYAASSTEGIRPLYDFLASIRTYSIEPEKLRELQEADVGEYLKKDGGNAAAVLKRLREVSTEGNGYKRLCNLLGKAVDGIKSVEYSATGQKETIKIKQDIGLKDPWEFETLNMSDGTLRILGILLAVFQPGHSTVLAFEEPEATIHPAVTEIVTEVLCNASHQHQVILTTHSPDILEYKYIRDDQIKLVSKNRNKTNISAISQAGRKAIKDQLYTAGELLRLDELNADEDDLIKQQNMAMNTQLELFPRSAS